MSMHEDDVGQMPVSEDNPCPFLRALVANGFVDGGTVPLPKLGGTIEAASGKHGLAARIVGIKTFGVALIANGLNPLRLLRSLVSGAELDHLRNGPLDKHGGGSRILNVDAQVQEDEIARLEAFGSDRPLPAGGTERGLDAGQVKAFMAANLKRDGAQARWYFPFLMKGEWPVLLDVMGKGDDSSRYLSTAEVRTLFVERRFPERITARLMAKPVPGGTIWRIGKAVIGVVGTVVICLIALSLVAALAYVAFPDKINDELPAALNKLPGTLPKQMAALVPPGLPPYQPAKTTTWLDQSWSDQDRHWFHHVSQGTATFPVPYDWFMKLEQPYFSLFSSPGLVSDSAYLERFGFMSSPKSTDSATPDLQKLPPAALPDLKPTLADNRGGLPVGFARLSGAKDPVTEVAEPDQIGLTCAACHSGSVNYKGTSVRFDGGPAMVDLRKLEKATGFAMLLTRYFPGRFDRFAERVLGAKASQEQRDKLKKGLEAALEFALQKQGKAYADEIASQGKTETDEGFGRLDALNRIGNQVFYLDMVTSGLSGFSKNQRAIDAPVSFPPIWTVPWFSWAQYDASISQPLIRNAGEALGVFAQINLSPEPPSTALFRSNIAIENLDVIERMLRGPDPFATKTPTFGGLAAPKWPDKLFPDDAAWRIDPARVERGRKLYAAICVECHQGPVNDPVFDKAYPDESFWKVSAGDTWDKGVPKGWSAKNPAGGPVVDLVEKPVADMGTDPAQAEVLKSRQVELPSFINLDPNKDMSDCNLPQISTTKMPYAVALMDVVQRASEKWMDERNMPEEQRTLLRGDRTNCPNPAWQVPIYRARPLNGVWATAPYLHNGSVPSLYWMLAPAGQRPTSFCQGRHDFDPKEVGFHVPPGGESTCATGETRFSTMGSDRKPIRGNSTMGHSFEGARRPNKDYPQGVVGGAFTDDERWDLIEYLKTL